jgi:hypothetical protein
MRQWLRRRGEVRMRKAQGRRYQVELPRWVCAAGHHVSNMKPSWQIPWGMVWFIGFIEEKGNTKSARKAITYQTHAGLSWKAWWNVVEFFLLPKKGTDHFSKQKVAQTLMVPMVASPDANQAWKIKLVDEAMWLRHNAWCILNHNPQHSKIEHLMVQGFSPVLQMYAIIPFVRGVILRSSLSHKKLFGGEEKPGTRHCHRSQTERRNKHRGNVCGGKNITRQCWLFAFLAEMKKTSVGTSRFSHILVLQQVLSRSTSVATG